MKILITGAAGFIGSHLSERLSDLGHEVVGVDSFEPFYSRVLKELNAEDIKAKGVKLHEKCLAEDDLEDVVEGVDMVFHLAAQPGIAPHVPFEHYLKNNKIATFKLLEALNEVQSLKMFVNVSTSSVYGLNANKSEHEAAEPASYYGVTKLAAEQLVLARHRESDFPACSLRLYSVYGERERPEKLYPRVYRSILTDYEFPFYEGSEDHLRSYTYVGDIIDAFVSLLDKDNMKKAKGEIFNIGYDKAITTGEALEIVEEVMGAPPKFYRKPRRAGDQNATHANIDKAREVLGYNPTTTPKEGFEKTSKWYKKKILPLIEDGTLK